MTPLLERHFHMTLIELVAFQVAVIIACGEAHLIGVSSFDEGHGTDVANVFVGEGDDALGGAAGEVRRGTLAMEVVGGPAESAGLGVGAVAAVVARVFTVTGKTIGEGGQFAFAKYRPWGVAWLGYSATL
jgi:hypothetical protein